MTTRRIVTHAWLLLAAVLVAAQALGLMHRIVHGPQVLPGHEVMAEAAAHGAGDAHAGHDHEHDHDHGPGWVGQMFSGHEDDSSCRLFDPLNHDALPGVPVLLLPLVLARLELLQRHGDFVARWRAQFDARGPPSLR